MPAKMINSGTSANNHRESTKVNTQKYSDYSHVHSILDMQRLSTEISCFLNEHNGLGRIDSVVEEAMQMAVDLV